MPESLVYYWLTSKPSGEGGPGSGTTLETTILVEGV